MIFSEQLNSFILILNCTAKEVAIASNINQTTLSRYCNGIRVPQYNSSEVERIAMGISTLAMKIAKERDLNDNDDIWKLTEYQYVKELLLDSMESKIDINQMIEKFAFLVRELDLKLNLMSKVVGYDSSYLSRIKAGQRKPSDPVAFIGNVCKYVVQQYENNKAIVAKVIGCEVSKLTDRDDFYAELFDWFGEEVSIPKSTYQVDGFLEGIDSFNLDDYIRSVNFDKLKVPSVPFNIIHSKTYYGIDGMKEAEIDFFKGTVLSKSQTPVMMYSDMPMEDMAQDLDFSKKWMFAIALTIKKGLNLRVIHDINRPFNELMLGLQSWIPLYMTGQISPYYFKEKQSCVFRQLTYVSGACALDGQCISSHHAHGKYTLFSSKSDMEYYKKRAEDMLSKANPLMEIYADSDYDLVEKIYYSKTDETGNYKHILSAPPIYTMNYELLERLLKRTGHEKDINSFWEKIMIQKDSINEILFNGKLVEEVPLLTKEEFEKYPPCLWISNCLYEIKYSYDEYIEHIELTKEFSKNKDNYNLQIAKRATFRNIQIRIIENTWAVISKRKTPAIHFVIHHSQLVNALWNFVPLVIE